MRRPFLIAATLLVACRAKPDVKPEVKSEPPPSASVVAVPSAAPVLSVSPLPPTPDAGTGPWVTLDAPKFTEDTGIMPGPKWRFAAPRLPAIDRGAGEVYIPYASSAHLASTVNFSVIVRSLATDRVVRTISILTEKEFGEGDEGDNAKRQSKYRELEARARTRIAKLNADLDALPLETLTACTLSMAPSNEPYGCSGPQRISCGTLTLTNKPSGRLVWVTGSADGGAHERDYPRLHPPPVPDFNVPAEDGGAGASIPTNECFSSVYVDVKREWLVGIASFVCQGGGDWCSVDSRDVALSLR